MSRASFIAGFFVTATADIPISRFM